MPKPNEEKVSNNPMPRFVLARPDSPDMAAPWLGGVCSGIAHYFGVPVVAVRILVVVLSFFGGIGFVGYMVIWILTPGEQGLDNTSRSNTKEGKPKAYDPQDPFRMPLRQVGVKRTNETIAGQLFVAGVAFVVIAFAIIAGEVLLRVNWRTVIWVALIVGGLFLAWVQAPKLSNQRTSGVISFVVLGVGLVLAGSFLLLAEFRLLTQVGIGLLVGFVTVAGIAVALVPLGLKASRDLSSARASEARETERAEIAAHLHDSVLQTLTLIRGAADDPARVRALALTQERELRTWLYTGETTPEVSVAQALRNQASNIETTYGTAIEVVTVGDAKPGPSDQAAVAAAAEAITNAVRHGSEPITVYQEVRDKTIEIFVKDAGDGFNPDDIPAHRHGFRNSIKGRVERVGGTVTVHVLPKQNGLSASGTEIRIAVPRTN